MLSEIVLLKKLGRHLESFKHLVLIYLFEIFVLKWKDRYYFLVLTCVVERKLSVGQGPLASRNVVRLQYSGVNHLYVDVGQRDLVVLLHERLVNDLGLLDRHRFFILRLRLVIDQPLDCDFNVVIVELQRLVAVLDGEKSGESLVHLATERFL